MSVNRAATIPPVHDSAVAAVQPRSRSRSSTISGSGRSSVAKTYSPRLEVICSASAAAGTTASCSARMSISISKLRAQMPVSTPGGSPPAAANRSATCDSPIP